MAQDNLPNLALADVLQGTLFNPQTTGFFPLSSQSDGQTLSSTPGTIYYGRRLTVKRVLITNLVSEIDSKDIENVTISLILVPVDVFNPIAIAAPKVVSLPVGESIVLDAFDDLGVSGKQQIQIGFEFDVLPVNATKLHVSVDLALGAETR